MARVSSCHVRAGPLLELDSYPIGVQIRSDCRSWSGDGRSASCGQSGTLQKMVDIAWREEKNRRYASDAVYPQSDGVEQVSFDQVSGAHHARPQKVLTRLRAGVKPALRGKVFDIGCGNSALLRDRGSGDPHRAIEGLSRNTQSQTLTEAIPGVTKLHVESLDRIQIRSDLIALILAVEHFPETVQHLKTLAKHLNPGGGVLFEVPGLESSPFDILIADHCTQFNLNTFKARIEAARLLTLTLSFGHAANELPLLVRSVVTPGPIIQANPDVAGGAVTSRPIAWLQAVLTRGRAAPAPQGIFISAISVAWLAVAPGDIVTFFVDENISRTGRTHMGSPTFALQQATKDRLVLMPLRTDIAMAAQARLSRAQLRFMLPPVQQDNSKAGL